ncbi:DEAD/DEAH box helicase [Nocardia tengchongensis]|uniref:DEAD/DEAH box helicase n=1 Tax=Nocardia tengchongensis TaxID=2055889 RepID=A0ABX8CWK5_9NOCA|nr:UvrD-helicase domain-containing protein [Nocardia tengchongensis]QVI24296.1 DEAD/DEAH box helicase [Nocardia tengchongensis]
MQAEKALAAVGPLSTRARNVLSGMLAEGRRGWHLLVRDSQPLASRGADAFLIGTGGVFGLVFDDVVPETPTARGIEAHAEQLFADLPVGNHRNVFVPETIELVLVVAPHGRLRAADGLRRVTELDYRSLFGSEARLDRGVAGRIAELVAARRHGYTLLSLDRPQAQVDSGEVGLIGTEHLVEGDRVRALAKPFPTWMTFLDPDQRALVAKNYNGPARIAGPAGSGKTVVALHRMARRARRTTGKLLFTTFVRNLPRCQEQGFAQLAPGAMHRTEFKNLHSWAREFLDQRGEPSEMKLVQADNAFNLAWSRVGSRGLLAEIEPDNRYWREEIDRLIKGRGIHDFDEYAGLDRRGRNGRLVRSARNAVWDLLTEYEQIRRRRPFLDSNDLIADALIELEKNPLEELYDMVVVDEVQDMSVLGLRLVHALTGDAPNALLLVGDGQQKIYAGGWRLSDAGIPIVGRGEVLRVNYRNCEAVLALAASLEGKTRVDNLDGDAGTALSRSGGALPGGTAERWSGSDSDVEEQVRIQLDRITVQGIPLSATALLTLTNYDADRFRAALRRWQVPFRNLEDYTGADEDMIKIGTVYRAKGLDFRAVLHPFFEKALPAEPLTDAERDRAELVINQRFVAVTRAREYVWLGTVER